jgi:predicted transcriptional regulator
LYEKILVERNQHKRIVNKRPGGRGGGHYIEYQKAPNKRVTRRVEKARAQDNLYRRIHGLPEIEYTF